MPLKPLTVTPEMGGRLIARRSVANFGFQNYSIKRDWRRDMGDEIRAEGRVYFRPNIEADLANQASPTVQDDVDSHERLNLLAQIRMPNGRLVTFAGTKTTLYRFDFSGDQPYFAQSGIGLYFEEDYIVIDYTADTTTGDYVIDGYVEGAEGFWKVIGTGFSEDGHRWEVVPVGPGYMIFNNGVDLWQSYHYPDSMVKPIYESREVGIVAVGSIAEFAHALMGFDISILKESKFAEVFSHIAMSGTAKQYGSFKSIPHAATAFFGGAVDLGNTGSGSSVSITDSADLDLSVDFAIEAVVHFDQTPTDSAFYSIFYKTDSYRLGARSIDGLWYLSLEVMNSSVRVPILSTVPLTHNYNDYAHVAVSVLDGNEVIFYLNGEPIEEFTTSFNSPDNTPDEAFVGLGGFGTTNATGGMRVAELRIWQVNRTESEIAANYASDVVGQAGLSAYWKFDDGSGTTAVDTAVGNDGTLNVGAVFIESQADQDSFIEMTTYPAAVGGLSNDGAGLATFAAATTHGLTTGQLVTISGSNIADYNVASVAVTVLDHFRFTYAMAVIGAGTSGGSPVFQRALFQAGHVGKEILFSNGFSADIVKFISTVRVKVGKSASSLDGDNRTFRIIATSTAALTGTVTKNAASATVAGVGTLFTTELSTGQLLRIGSSEEVRQVVSIASDTSLTVDSDFDLTEAGVTAHRVSDYTVLSSLEVFDATTMVGKQIYFEDGTSRTIIAVENSKRVTVDDHRSIVSQTFMLENDTAYDAITNGSLFDRFRYRAVWSARSEPRTWESSPPGSIEAGSVRLELDYQAKSFERGMTIVVTGAGILGGNLTAEISRVLDNNTTIILKTPASTTVESVDVQRVDSIGSIAGYDDLDRDAAAIIRGLDLSGDLVVYKEHSVYIGVYTGNVDEPFAFRWRHTGQDTPFYRWTLQPVTIGQTPYHLYRGRNSFYLLSNVTFTPSVAPELEDVERIFTSGIVDDIDEVYAFVNPITKEWCMHFPSDTDDKGIYFDYLFRTVRTTSDTIDAGCQINRVSGDDNEFAHNWVVVAGSDSRVYVYGKTDAPEPLFGARDSVYSRAGGDYPSILRSSMWGSRNGETVTGDYIPELSSEAVPDFGQLTFNLYGIDNPARGPELLATETIELPADEPAVGTHFEKMMFQDELIITGNRGCRLSARTIHAIGLDTQAHARRET